MKDSMQGMQPGRHYRMEQDYKEIQMPRKMLYRLRAQLTIVREACELARVDPSTLFIVTLGQRLLREGLTVKTWRHDLPPTIMICSIPSHKLIKRPAVELIQALGRLCGLRQAPYDKAPTLLLHESAVPVFKAMVDCNHALCQRVASRIRSNPNISLGAAAAGEFPTLFERILSRRLQHVPNEELYGSEELCQHNAEFFDPITRHRMLSLLERHFNEKELALIFNMLETLREPDLSPDRSDFSPSEYFTFNEMWGYLMNCDLVEDETRLEERFYNGVVKKLIALAERPETSGASGLIAVAERAGIEHGQGAVPIYLARDSFADGSEWGILTSWNISKWLKTRCSCETRDQESRHFVRCSKCSFWYHQACFADLNQFVVESGGEIEGLMYLCGNCRQNFVDLTDED